MQGNHRSLLTRARVNEQGLAFLPPRASDVNEKSLHPIEQMTQKKRDDEQITVA